MQLTAVVSQAAERAPVVAPVRAAVAALELGTVIERLWAASWPRRMSAWQADSEETTDSAQRLRKTVGQLLPVAHNTHVSQCKQRINFQYNFNCCNSLSIKN